jgi:hypothetical protein
LQNNICFIPLQFKDTTIFTPREDFDPNVPEKYNGHIPFQSFSHEKGAFLTDDRCFVAQKKDAEKEQEEKEKVYSQTNVSAQNYSEWKPPFHLITNYYFPSEPPPLDQIWRDFAVSIDYQLPDISTIPVIAVPPARYVYLIHYFLTYYQ